MALGDLSIIHTLHLYETASDPSLSLSNTAVAQKVVAVHEREIVQKEPSGSQTHRVLLNRLVVPALFWQLLVRQQIRHLVFSSSNRVPPLIHVRGGYDAARKSKVLFVHGNNDAALLTERM